MTRPPHTWEIDYDPESVELPDAPAWLLGGRGEDSAKSNGRTEPLPPIIKDGEWHKTMVSAAGTMRARGFTEAATVAALIEQNATYDGEHGDDGSDIRDLVADIFRRYDADHEIELRRVEHQGDVDGAELLDALVAHFARFMVMSDAQLAAVALFALMTHVVDAFYVVPYLRIFAPSKECGKSQLIDLLRLVVYRPIACGGTSEAALFRSLANGAATLLWDEIGRALGPAQRDRNSSLEAILLNGFTAGMPVLRCVGEGSKQTVEPFNVFGPKVLGGTGRLDDMIVSRCFPIQLKKKMRREVIERHRGRLAPGLAEPLYARMAAWAVAHVDELASAEPALPEELSDRGQDIAEPLLAIADLVGGTWPARARRAVVELRGGPATLGVDEDAALLLLADIRKVFDELSVDRLSTDDLIGAICRDPERPWKTWTKRDEPISPRSLAGLLRDFEITSRTIRLSGGEGTARGYLREQFEDAWERYL